MHVMAFFLYDAWSTEKVTELHQIIFYILSYVAAERSSGPIVYAILRKACPATQDSNSLPEVYRIRHQYHEIPLRLDNSQEIIEKGARRIMYVLEHFTHD